jgi:IclR family transcriptional regulator, acetate operon repressor
LNVDSFDESAPLPAEGLPETVSGVHSFVHEPAHLVPPDGSLESMYTLVPALVTRPVPKPLIVAALTVAGPMAGGAGTCRSGVSRVPFRVMESVSHDGTHGASRSVDRVCAVLGAFTVAAPQLTLGELTARTGLPKPTVHRLAGSLVANGFLRHEHGGRYALGTRLSELGGVARAELDVAESCRPVLDAVAAQVNETVMLAIPDWDALELTVISSRVSDQLLPVMPLVGRHFAISAGAIGKALLLGLSEEELVPALSRASLPAWTERSLVEPEALLADLSECRKRGFAVAHGEFADGVTGVAVPVLWEGGRPRATVGVSGPSFRLDDRLDRLGEMLLELTANLRLPADAVPAVA